MPAITKSWTDIADTAIDPDSPITTGLMTALRDNAIYLREWLGAGFTAGAVQDHNHDGVNSAKIETGPNYLRNGSFEDGEAGWTFTNFSGGSRAVSTSQSKSGEKSMALTSTVLANGGAEGISNDYIPVSEGFTNSFVFFVGASVANVSSRIEFVWYDAAKSQISTTTLYTSTNTPTTLTLGITAAVTPTTARFARVRITGPVPGQGSATGTVYFDGLSFGANVIGASAQILSNVIINSHLSASCVTSDKIADNNVTQSKLAAAAVGQAQLKTTTAAGAVLVGAVSGVTYSLAGGTYSLWTAGAEGAGFAFGHSDTAAGVLGLINTDSNGGRYFWVDERYVQASPPYDLGDGHIPLFIWLWLDSLGALRGHQIAQDPPWAYHGPTDIRPQYTRNGKPYRAVATTDGIEITQARRDRAKLARLLAGTADVIMVEQEIDNAWKNRDMPEWPHPFVGNDLAGTSIVLVDPMSPLVERLRTIQETEGARAVSELLRDGWLEVDNLPLQRATPPGVLAVSARLK